jgi:hypothetical protein
VKTSQFTPFHRSISPSCSKVDEQGLKERDEFILMRVFIARLILSQFMCRPAFGDIERRSSHVTLQKRWAPKPFLSISGQIADRSGALAGTVDRFLTGRS